MSNLDKPSIYTQPHAVAWREKEKPDRVQLLIKYIDMERRMRFVADIQWRESEEGMRPPPTVEMSIEAAQILTNCLWDLGFRASGHSEVPAIYQLHNPQNLMSTFHGKPAVTIHEHKHQVGDLYMRFCAAGRDYPWAHSPVERDAFWDTHVMAYEHPASTVTAEHLAMIERGIKVV